jgi:hypothetical protein
MHTVVETAPYLNAAKEAGMSREEMDAVVTLIAENPSAGVQIAGTGGCRKLRVPRPGQGKSGGYRLITFYSGPKTPVFVLTVFTKNEKANLSKADQNALSALTKRLVKGYLRSREGS